MKSRIERKIEVYDISPLAWACLGAGIKYGFEWGFHWSVVVLESDTFSKAQLSDLVDRVIGVSNSTPGIEIKTMAQHCLLGMMLNGETECQVCGSKSVPKTTGEPPWRVKVHEVGL